MAWDRIAAVIAFSASIGARAIVCPVEDGDAVRRAESFARLCDLCRPYDIRALVEFNPYSACRSLAEAQHLLDAVPHPAAGLVIDTLHLSRSGGSPADLAQVDPRRLVLLHLCDAPPPPESILSVDALRAESRTARLLPGEGALWLDELLAALPTATWISVEAPSSRHAHLPAAVRAARALAATQELLERCGRAEK